MKKLITLALLFFTFNSYSQKLTLDKNEKIDMHLLLYQQEQKEGKAFVITGFAIGLAGVLIGQGTGKDKDEFANAMGMIGATFSAYGFVSIFNSGRHLKKVKWLSESTAIR